MRDYARSIKSTRRRKPITIGVKGTVLLISGFLIFTVGFIFWITKDLPTPDSIIKNTKYSTTLLDRNDKVIYRVYTEKNIVPVTFSDIPKSLIQATIAIEDKEFFTHKGFSLWGIFRAGVRDILFHRREGGSTITQQLVKNTLLTSEKSIPRKLKEFILAVELERRYSKDQILEMYFNQTPYGGTAYGVGSAAKYYFNKTPKELTLPESAILAGLPQSPSVYSPYFGSKDAYIARTKEVLRRMREDGYITKKQELDLGTTIRKVTFAGSSEDAIQATHFVFYVKDELDIMLSDNALYQRGLVIRTTLDLNLQKEVENIVKDEIKNAKDLDISNGAVVVMKAQTGEILAMVGSYDYNDKKFGKFNAALGLRQPGSTLKPFTYALAFENNYTPASTIMDVKTTFKSGQNPDEKPYEPDNYDGKYHGPVQMRFALGSSLNIPAVKTLASVGIENLLQKLYDAGLKSLEPTSENMKRFGLSLTLGGGEVTLLDLTSAYTAFANGGVSARPIGLVDVQTYGNKKLYTQPKTEKKQVYSQDVSFLISHILSDNIARNITFGPNNYLIIPGKTVAAKTGTTDDKRDNWTVGYTKDIVVGVWVGNNDNSKMNPNLASGVSGAAPIWRRVFIYALSHGYKDGIIDKPAAVDALTVDSRFGGLPNEDFPTRSEYFIKGTEPTDISSSYTMLKLSKSTGKLANDFEISHNDYEEKLFFVVNETDPLSLDGSNRWQEGIDAWAREQSEDRWKPPTEFSENNKDAISISVSGISDQERIDTSPFEITASVSSNKNIEYFRFHINNTLEKETRDKKMQVTISKDPGIYTFTFTAKNEAGNESKQEFTVGVKTDPKPTVTL
ncbi:penicillin-binding protein [Candidatus Roizmanbacteria bacterium CG10_big_fil_rev_8_21_14_0_10_39_6]|uniref:Penicillin-binding protein n=1 Tax=Candidatus Roizmanbacteria bacterium CG10_big_fil_rev_8_21_14_0_10_39_6 TaxID=1974853 RepID=A0A2M8KS10_9BACT|nr:MAG: penicillin-binding protein [Candidatus Roizmanbacteria bacterium CG10_big_fil_rev_8_21_14_0_10_39_6]